MSNVIFLTHDFVMVRPRKKCLFPLTDREKRVARSVSIYFFVQKCVLCIIYVDWELGGRKKLWG